MSPQVKFDDNCKFTETKEQQCGKSLLGGAIASRYDILMMTEEEGRELAAIPKQGEPRSAWSQDKGNTLTNAFGVLDASGKTIKGVTAEFDVFISPNLGQIKMVFSLKRYNLGATDRAYQLEVNLRKDLRPTDHAYSHEHYGEKTFKADTSWAHSSFQDAVNRFCTNTNLTLTDTMPDYADFTLKPN